MKKIYLFLLIGFPIGAMAQNNCATALPIGAGTYTVSAVNGAGFPTVICAPNGNTNVTAGEWYTYTPSTDYTVTLTTDLPGSAGIDTRFHVYTGTCGTLVCHSGDDDSGGGLTSVATFSAMAGTTYIIAFDNRWSSAGFDFQLIENPYVEPILPPVEFTATPVGVSGSYSLATVDMNGDYLDDIVTVSGGSIQILYQQAGGGFSTVTYTTTNNGYLPSWSLAVGDIDKNGFNDIVYGDGSGVTFMKANATGTGYTESFTSEYVFSQRSNFQDINGDGHLDAFVCHDVDPNVYYINDGAGNLTYAQGGMGDHSEGGNYGSIWVDYDNDGDPDMFIAKCRGGGSTAAIDELHRNNGDGTFTEVGVAANMANGFHQSWSAAWNDFDNDGWMDALVGASSSAEGTHKLMKNNGDGTFTDVTAGTGWDTNPNLNIEHVSFDFDNNGFADVFGGGNEIMFNNGDMTFSPVDYSFTNGSIGDLNNDGFLDIRNGGTVYMNNGNANNWIKINLQGVQSNGNGIGARIEIYGAWGKQIRDVRSGDGFRYMNTLNAHFGIGTATEIDSIYIKWPSGNVDHITDPTINEELTVVEGSSPLSLLEVNGKKITLFPNPASDVITIDNLSLLNPVSVTVLSNIGTEVMKQDKNNPKLNISALANGLYIVIIETASGERYSQTFIKK